MIIFNIRSIFFFLQNIRYLKLYISHVSVNCVYRITGILVLEVHGSQCQDFITHFLVAPRVTIKSLAQDAYHGLLKRWRTASSNWNQTNLQFEGQLAAWSLIRTPLTNGFICRLLHFPTQCIPKVEQKWWMQICIQEVVLESIHGDAFPLNTSNCRQEQIIN